MSDKIQFIIASLTLPALVIVGIVAYTKGEYLFLAATGVVLALNGYSARNLGRKLEASGLAEHHNNRTTGKDTTN